jgi:hypothetical protein
MAGKYELSSLTDLAIVQNALRIGPNGAEVSRLRNSALRSQKNNPRYNPVMASPPTVSDSTTITSGFTNSYRYSNAKGAVFSYGGGGQATLFGVYRQFPCIKIDTAPTHFVWKAKAEVDADIVLIGVYHWQAAGYRFVVDGQYVTLTPRIPAGNNALNYIKLDFTSAGGKRKRTITIEGHGGNAFDGFYTTTIDGVYRSGDEALRGILLGDSMSGNGGITSNFDGLGNYAFDALGVFDGRSSGVGSTGYIANSTGTQPTFVQRIGDLTGPAPDIGIIAGGFNDTSYPSQDRQSAVLSTLQAARAAEATKYIPLFVTEPFAESSPFSTSTDIATAVAAMADDRIRLIRCNSDPAGAWFTGTGTVESPNGTGNADLYRNNSDLIHRNAAGNAHWGRQLADAITRELLTMV